MERIAQRDLRALLALLDQLDGSRDLDAFAANLLRLLHGLIPVDMISFNEVNLKQGRIRTIVDPIGALPSGRRGEQLFEPHMREHPLIRHYTETRDGQALKLSDFLSQRQFHQLGLYQAFFRQFGVEHQIAVTLPSSRPLIIGVALNRGQHDFSERDRLLLNLLRPRLVRAYRRAEASLRIRQALDAFERGMEIEGYALVLLSRTGQPPLMTALARRWLNRYFGTMDRRPSQLPDAVQTWLAVQEQGCGGDDELPPPAEPLVVEGQGGRLIVRFVPETAADEPALLLLKEINADQFGELAPASSLTPRETEVLRLVVRGQTNTEVGGLLGVSDRTVQKHLEHVFSKLGVESRTAAAAWAFRNWSQQGADSLEDLSSM